jgi:16S rRNA (uracil1498-N3)-methyltransferase
MQLLWLEQGLQAGQKLVLDSAHARHLRDVLRMKVGTKFTLRSPLHEGYVASGVLTVVSKKSVELEVVELTKLDAPRHFIELVQGYPKGSKFDDIAHGD